MTILKKKTFKIPKLKKQKFRGQMEGSNLRIYRYGIFNRERHLSNTKKFALDFPYTLLPKCLTSC